MELDQAISLWRGGAALLGATSSMSKDNDPLILITSTEDVREISATTQKCINHWTFRAGSAHALSVAATRHPQSRAYFGVCNDFGVNSSKKARQAKRQETKKSMTLPVNEGLAVWRDTDLDVSNWRRTPLQAATKVYSLLVHAKLKEDIVVVFQDGSFATFDENLTKGLDSDDAKDAASIEEENEDDGEDLDASVVWSYLETDHRSSVKGALFLSILMQKTNLKSDRQLDLLVYRITIPHGPKCTGDGALGAILLVRHRVNLHDNDELSSCAFHAETFSYSMIGRSGCWQTLRFSWDTLTDSLTHVTTQQMPNLASAEPEFSVPGCKKRKFQAAYSPASGYWASNVGNSTYLVSTALDSPLKFTGWDSKFAVPVSHVKIPLAMDIDTENEVFVGRSSKDGLGKIIQLGSVGAGNAVLVAYERGVFLIHVRNTQSTLASVIGATALTALIGSESAAMPDRFVQWEHVTATSSVDNDTLDAAMWKSNLCRDDERERRLIADLSDPQVTPTAAAFTHRLDEALKHDKNQKPGVDSEELSYRLLQTVTRRCLDSTELGLWQPLDTMLRTNRLSARAEPMLLPTLMQHNQFALLECAIVHLVDIDERSIVRLLKYSIRKSSNSDFIDYVTKQIKVQNKKACNIDGIAVCERFAVALLGLPTNAVFLHRAIRELEVEEVLLVLAICKKLLLVQTTDEDSDSGDETTKSLKKAKKSKGKSVAGLQGAQRFTLLPSASQCCSWVCALLDAHLATLVQRASQNAEVSRTLHQLNELVQLQLRASAQYESVHGVLSNFLSGVRLPRAPGLPGYSLEELCL